MRNRKACCVLYEVGNRVSSDLAEPRLSPGVTEAPQDPSARPTAIARDRLRAEALGKTAGPSRIWGPLSARLDGQFAKVHSGTEFSGTPLPWVDISSGGSTRRLRMGIWVSMPSFMALTSRLRLFWKTDGYFCVYARLLYRFHRTVFYGLGYATALGGHATWTSTLAHPDPDLVFLRMGLSSRSECGLIFAKLSLLSEIRSLFAKFHRIMIFTSSSPARKKWFCYGNKIRDNK